MKDRHCYTLWSNIYDIDNEKSFIVNAYDNEYLIKYLKSSSSLVSAFCHNSKACTTIQELFNIVYNVLKDIVIDYNFYDAVGSAYEEFKTNYVGNTGKHTGQHFTPIIIKKYIIDELKPKYTELFYEPCCGTGGFIHTAYSYLFHNNKENCDKFKEHIYANECNPEIVKPLMINMLIHNIPITYIEEKDSLDFMNRKETKDKFDIIATNPPFGMKTEQEDDDYWQPITTGNKVIKNSTAQFLIHISNSLKIGGRAGVVIDRGILNNGNNATKSWELKFRHWFIKNNNITKIVLVPSGTFDYTNFATAIIFFEKGTFTHKIKYYNGLDENVEPFKTITFKELKKK